MNKYALPALAAGFVVLLCGAAAPASARGGDGDYCREYTRQVTIGGRVETSYGYACLQPDGQWLIDGDRNRPLPSQAVYYDEVPRFVPQQRRPVYFIDDDHRGHKSKRHRHDDRRYNRYYDRDHVVYYRVPSYYYHP